jgi:hypothetical protein
VVTLSVSTVFLVAASYKVIGAPKLGEALEALGVQGTLSKALARTFWIVEVAFAIAIASGLHGLSDSGLVLGGLMLVAVGTRAESLDKPIPCSCFGTGNVSSLGSRQIVFGGLLTLTGLVLWKASPGVSNVLEIFIRVTAVSTLAFTARLIADVGLLREQIRLRRIFSAEYPA